MGLARHHQMMVDDGLPVACLRQPGEPRPSPPPAPTPLTIAKSAPRFADDAELRREADRMWREWMPTAKERTRPQLRTILKRLRDQQKAAMPKPGPKELATRAMGQERTTTKKRLIHHDDLAFMPSNQPPAATPAPTAAPAACVTARAALAAEPNQEADMATTTTKRKPATKTKTRAKSTARRKTKSATKSARKPSADAEKQRTDFLELVKRDGGATFEQITAKIGWKVRKWLFTTATAAGLDLNLERDGKGAGRYVATAKKQ